MNSGMLTGASQAERHCTMRTLYIHHTVMDTVRPYVQQQQGPGDKQWIEPDVNTCGAQAAGELQPAGRWRGSSNGGKVWAVPESLVQLFAALKQYADSEPRLLAGTPALL